jgi:hypothetical protein
MKLRKNWNAACENSSPFPVAYRGNGNAAKAGATVARRSSVSCAGPARILSPDPISRRAPHFEVLPGRQRRDIFGIFNRQEIRNRLKQAVVRSSALPFRSLLRLVLGLPALLLTSLSRG